MLDISYLGFGGHCLDSKAFKYLLDYTCVIYASSWNWSNFHKILRAFIRGKSSFSLVAHSGIMITTRIFYNFYPNRMVKFRKRETQ